MDVPLVVVGGLDEIHALHVCVAEAVVHGERGARVIHVRRGRGGRRCESIEAGGRPGNEWGRGARVQVCLHVDATGLLGLDQRRVDAQRLAFAGNRAGFGGAEHLQPVAVGVDDVAIAIHLEVAGARVDVGTFVVQHEEAAAVDGDVEHVFGYADVALRESLIHADYRHALARRGTGGAEQARGEDVGKFAARGLEARGAGVRDVVADDAEADAGRLDPGYRCVE